MRLSEDDLPVLSERDALALLHLYDQLPSDFYDKLLFGDFESAHSLVVLSQLYAWKRQHAAGL